MPSSEVYGANGGVSIKSPNHKNGTFFFGGGGDSFIYKALQKKKNFLFGGWVGESVRYERVLVSRSYMILLGFDDFLLNVYSFEGK